MEWPNGHGHHLLDKWLLYTHDYFTQPPPYIHRHLTSFLSFCDTCHCQSEQTSNNTFSKIQFVENNNFLFFCSFVEVISTFSFGWFLVKFHPKMKTFISPIVIVWTKMSHKINPTKCTWNFSTFLMKNNNIKFLKLMT